jgi:hypothetical protein
MGDSLFSLSRRMGTSVDMIDRTYGHLAPGAEAVEPAMLNAYDAEKRAFGQLSGTGFNASDREGLNKIPAQE